LASQPQLRSVLRALPNSQLKSSVDACWQQHCREQIFCLTDHHNRTLLAVMIATGLREHVRQPKRFSHRNGRYRRPWH
jgi:hypothetical protein